MIFFAVLPCLPILAIATPVIYDGRAPLSLTDASLDTSTGPYLTVVKGSTKNASHYSSLLGDSVPPTPLWNEYSSPIEQTISVTIDNSSVFVPGGAAPQFGFRRTEFIAQANGSSTALDSIMEAGTTVFHVSIQVDETRPLNLDHEYQIVFIEPDDGTHVFEIQIGSPFTNPTGSLPAQNAHSFKVLDHALNVLFITSCSPAKWHNFAIQVDWNNRTLAVLYSEDDAELAAVTKVLPNLTASLGATGRGDFHFGVLKLPLVNPADSSANQADVAHFGIQEGKTEGLLYSGIFVEQVTEGVSVGNGHTIPQMQ